MTEPERPKFRVKKTKCKSCEIIKGLKSDVRKLKKENERQSALIERLRESKTCPRCLTAKDDSE